MACPICHKPADAKYRPFCSRRCADVDLGRWLNEGYRIESPPSEEDETPSQPSLPANRPN